MQRDVLSGSRGKGKRGTHEVREKQMPGDKKDQGQGQMEGAGA